jgi:hypothetical protein
MRKISSILLSLCLIFSFFLYMGATWPSDSARTKEWSASEILTEPDLEGQFDVIHTWLNDAFDETNGHKHDATGNEGPKILTANIDDSAGTAGDIYTNTGGTTIGRVAIGADNRILASTGSAPAWEVLGSDHFPDGVQVQKVYTQTGTSSTGTTTIPFDTSTPQNTEGDEYMTLAVTPASTTNDLEIQVVAHVSHTSTSGHFTCALFQDSTADALASGVEQEINAQKLVAVTFSHNMNAGTASATTFKVRCGSDQSGTMTFNGTGGSGKLNSTIASSIVIMETKDS